MNIFGLKWNPFTDTLTLPSRKPAPKQQLATERTVLKVSFKIYDPLGLLLPVTIRAKPTNVRVVTATAWVGRAAPTYLDRSCNGKKLLTTWRKQRLLPFSHAYFRIRSNRPLQPSYLSLRTQSLWGCLLYHQRQLVLSRQDQIKSRPTEKKLTLPRVKLMAKLTGAELPDGIHFIIDFSTYTILCKLIGVIAYILPFIRNASAKERHSALYVWINTCQAQTFLNEIAKLTCHSQTRPSSVWQLRLFLDTAGFLRCRRRIHNAPLEDLTNFPSSFLHIKHLHSRVNATVTAVRQTFWITSIRQHVRTQLKHCATCRKLDEQPQILCLFSQ